MTPQERKIVYLQKKISALRRKLNRYRRYELEEKLRKGKGKIGDKYIVKRPNAIQAALEQANERLAMPANHWQQQARRHNAQQAFEQARQEAHREIFAYNEMPAGPGPNIWGVRPAEDGGDPQP